MRTDAFTARPSRSQSFRDPPLKGQWGVTCIGRVYFWSGQSMASKLCSSSPSDVDATLCGIERQRPGSLSSALGGQSHAFPALPRPSGVFPHVDNQTLATSMLRKNIKYSRVLHLLTISQFSLRQAPMCIHPLLKLVPPFFFYYKGSSSRNVTQFLFCFFYGLAQHQILS